MATIKGQELSKLIALFKKRGACFYHACQYKDFKTYLCLGGVPSRSLMEKSGKSGLPFTQFVTDEQDRTNGVWDKVFGNLTDFGFGFARGEKNPHTAPTPNPYGPIQLVYRPEVFEEVEDVAICLRSAGGRNFDRDKEALANTEEVNRIFLNPLQEENTLPTFDQAYIKFSADLKKEFGFGVDYKRTLNPEVSMIVNGEKISFAQIDKILVDFYEVDGISLLSKVQQTLKNWYGLKCEVSTRDYHEEEGEDRKNILTELTGLMLQGKQNFADFKAETTLSPYTIDWLNRIEKGNLIYQFNRFAEYLRSGTVLELHSENMDSRPLSSPND